MSSVHWDPRGAVLCRLWSGQTLSVGGWVSGQRRSQTHTFRKNVDSFCWGCRGGLDGCKVKKLVRVILFGLMTPHGWHWAGWVRLLKWETSRKWIWPQVMDPAPLVKGQGGLGGARSEPCVHFCEGPATRIGSERCVCLFSLADYKLLLVTLFPGPRRVTPRASASVWEINDLHREHCGEPGTELNFACPGSHETLSIAPGKIAAVTSAIILCSRWCRWSGRGGL